MKLNNLTHTHTHTHTHTRARARENIIKFDSNLVYYLLNAYINLDVYFEIDHKNGLIYVLPTYES